MSLRFVYLYCELTNVFRMTNISSFNPEIHNRKSIRIPEYDYTKEGFYFVTICCHEHQCLFGRIINGEMVLNECGRIAKECWEEIPNRFVNIDLHSFIIMPNHIHGILQIKEIVGAGFTPAQIDITRATARVAPTIDQKICPALSDIIGAYKSLVANCCLKLFKEKNLFMGKLWQRNYNEHVIRNEHSYNKITEYIHTNPTKWKFDKFYHM